MAVLFALPALAGIAWGLISGGAQYTLIGVGVTFILLAGQRFLNTPLSFRAALRAFNGGDTDRALRLINKSIEARPDYWESYQLRALIYLSRLDLARAERDAKTAVSRRPDAHPVYNTLGQVYLAQARFAEAEAVYAEAVERAPDNDLYHYHLGLSRYRREKYRPAAEALARATRGSLPRAMYDLAAHYYLGGCLEALGEPDAAAEAFAAMSHFRGGLAALRRQLRNQPPYPHLEQMRADAADMAARLGMGEEEE
jgi:tetratricopeptide (TPR) repeat protein